MRKKGSKDPAFNAMKLREVLARRSGGLSKSGHQAQPGPGPVHLLHGGLLLPSNAAISNATVHTGPHRQPMANPVLATVPRGFPNGLQPNRQLSFANSMGPRWTTQPHHARMTNASANTHQTNAQQPIASNAIPPFHPYAHQHANFMRANSSSMNNHPGMSNGLTAISNQFNSTGSHRLNPNAHQSAISIGGSGTTSSYHAAVNNGRTNTQARQLAPPVSARQNMPMRVSHPTSISAAPQTTVVRHTTTNGIHPPQLLRMPTATITLATNGLNHAANQYSGPGNCATQPGNASQAQNKDVDVPSANVQSNPVPSTSGHHQQAAERQPTAEQMEEIFRVAYVKHMSRTQTVAPTFIPDNISIDEFAQLYGEISNEDLMEAEDEVFAASARKK